jgi:hypothetical protein
MPCLLRKKEPSSNHRKGYWVDHKPDLDVLEKIKISSQPGFEPWIDRPVSWSLY